MNFLAEPHLIIAAGETQEVDLGQMFRGYTNDPTYLYNAVKGWAVTARMRCCSLYWPIMSGRMPSSAPPNVLRADCFAKSSVATGISIMTISPSADGMADKYRLSSSEGKWNTTYSLFANNECLR